MLYLLLDVFLLLLPVKGLGLLLDTCSVTVC
jgi:hypothetical protein